MAARDVPVERQARRSKSSQQGPAGPDGASAVEFFSQRDPAVPNDRWVIECILPNKRHGYFVEAGARDGITDSNTYTLEKYFGWDGICVEPHPDEYGRLIENRTRNCGNVCLYDVPGSVQFLEHVGLGGIVEHIRHAEQVRDSPIIEAGRLHSNSYWRVIGRRESSITFRWTPKERNT